MNPCHCGRLFKSEAALRQHQQAKHQPTDVYALAPVDLSVSEMANSQARSGSGTSKRGANEAWMWKGVKHRDTALSSISLNSLEPSAASVSSSLPAELICSYNWLVNNGVHTIKVPGKPPNLHVKFLIVKSRVL